VSQRNLFHSILIFTTLHQVHRSIGSFANQLEHFEATDKLLTTRLSSILLEVPHLLKVLLDLYKVVKWRLLVQLFQKWNVCLEVLVIVSDIDKGPKDACREDHLKRLSVLLDRVLETETAEAVKLDLVLDLHVFICVFRVTLTLLVLAHNGAVIHQDASDDVRAVESDAYVVLIVETQVGQRCEDAS